MKLLQLINSMELIMIKKIKPIIYSNFKAITKPFIYNRNLGDYVSPNNKIANSDFQRGKYTRSTKSISTCSSFHNFNIDD